MSKRHGTTAGFIHGTTYYHFAHPVEEFAADFREMRGLGLNAVRVAEIWPGWDVLEPSRGTYDFADLDRFVDQAGEAGLQVVMGIGVNSPPDWVFHEMADVRCVDSSGKAANRRVQSGNHDNPEYRDAMAEFIVTMAKRYGPKREVMAWQMGNEVRYGVGRPDNPCTRRRFRDWLMGKFGGDLGALNLEWGTKYATWERVLPYLSQAGAPTEGLTPLALATQAYMHWSLEELVAWGAALVRRHSDKPVFHNNHGMSGETYSHWRMAASGDWAVQDLYPTIGGAARETLTLGLDVGTSVAASLGKPYVIGETGVAQYGTYRRNRPEPAWCECMAMEMVAAGARGILYFRHRAPKFEQPHKFTGSQAVFRRDGSATPYARTIERVSEVIGRLGDRIMAASPVEPAVAAYYPEESLGLGAAAGFADLQGAAVSGTSSLWNRMGVPLRWLDTERFLAADLERFTIVYLPLCYLLPLAVGERLARYVAAGGTLVSECRPGYVDGAGWLYREQPGAGLHEVFGAREDLFWEPVRQEVRVAADGWSFTGSFPAVAQTYRCGGTRAIARNERGETAGVRSRFGKGTAWLFGFAPSLTFNFGGGKYQEGAARGGSGPESAGAVELVTRIASGAGVKRPFDWRNRGDGLNVRYLREPSGGVLGFFANHGDETELTIPDKSVTIAAGTPDKIDFRARRGAVVLPRHGWAIVEAQDG
jgi:beta-galactosidase GanA